MKQKMFSLFVCIAMLFQLCVFNPVYAQTGELGGIVENGGFENGMDSWSADAKLFSADTTEKRTGNASLKVSVDEAKKKAWNKVTQTVNVTAGKTYALSFYSKLVSGKGVHYIDDNKYVYTIPEKEWTKHTTVFTAESNTVTIGFGNYYGQAFEFYADDIQVTEVDAKKLPETVLNGDFENPVDGLGWKLSDVDFFGISETEKYSGNRSLMLKVESEQNKSYSSYFQKIDVTEGKEYQLEFYCKSVSGQAVVKVEYGDKKVAEKHIGNASDWKKYSIDFIPETDAVTIRVLNNAGSKSKNEFYFDDFNLKYSKHVVYVSESGNDDDSGSINSPLRTIDEAKKRIKKLREDKNLPCEVVLRGGTYRVGNSITFDEADSGTETSPIKYMAYADEKVYIKGSAEIDVLQSKTKLDKKMESRLRDDVKDKIIALDLQEYITKDDIGSVKKISSYSPISGQNGYEYMNLYSDDNEQMLAQWPNGKEKFARWDDVITVGGKSESAKDLDVKGVFKYSGDVPDRWSNAADWWIGGYPSSDYRYERNSVYAIDTENKTITLATPTSSGLNHYANYTKNAERSRRWKAYNLPEEIDVPGEWYIDPDSLILYYYPNENVDYLELSLLKDPIISINDAEYIEFSGIEFSQSRNYAISMMNVNNITIDNCVFKNLDRGAITTTGAQKSQRDTIWWQKQYLDAANESIVSNCIFNNIGGTCITLSGGNVDTLTPGNSVIENNIIYDYSYNIGQSPAISIGGCGNVVRNNNISKGAFHAINYAGNDHKILYNEIYDVNRIVDDVGAIYSGRSYLNRGTEIAYNYIHDIQPQAVEGMNFGFSVGIYWDDSLCGQYAHHNIIKDALVGVYSCGQCNRFDNNVLINCTRKNYGGINYSTNYEKTALDEEGRVAKSWQPQYDSLADKSLYSSKYPHFDEGILPEYAVVNAWAEIKGNINVNSDAFIAPSVLSHGVYEEYNVSQCADFNNEKIGDYTIKAGSKTAEKLPGLINNQSNFAIENMGVQRTIILDNTTSPITKISPIENASGNNIVFMWDNAFGANEYRLIVSEDAEFKNIKNEIEMPINLAVVENLDKNKNYFWKVCALNKSKRIGAEWESDVFELNAESDIGYADLQIKNASGTVVDSLDKITDGSINVFCNLINCTNNQDWAVKAITALYDPEGRLVGAHLTDAALKYQQYEPISASFDVQSGDLHGYSVGVMIWNNSQTALRKKIVVK